MKKIALIGVLLAILTTPSLAVIDAYTFDNPRQEAQYRALIEEFRCPKCQNQNLAGSDAPIAQDLKKKTYDMVKDGRSDTEIRNYMYERYGDFISYKPPVRPSTWILWFLPPVILLLGVLGWLLRQRYQRKRILHETPQSEGTSASETTPHLSDQERQRLNTILNKQAVSKQVANQVINDASHPNFTHTKE